MAPKKTATVSFVEEPQTTQLPNPKRAYVRRPKAEEVTLPELHAEEPAEKETEVIPTPAPAIQQKLEQEKVEDIGMTIVDLVAKARLGGDSAIRRAILEYERQLRDLDEHELDDEEDYVTLLDRYELLIGNLEKLRESLDRFI